MAVLQIPSTLNIICACWNSAENDLRNEIATQSPDKPEEYITDRFHGLFKKELDVVSSHGQVEQAFLSDLGAAFPDLQYGNVLGRVANGLIAQAVLHHHGTEGRTGGDIGLVINRPQITSNGTMLFNQLYQHGLLCQAKLRDRYGKWGKLTKPQRKSLPNALQYFGLILYEYKDKARYTLQPFRWQLGRSAKQIDDVVQWLEQGKFPSRRRSANVITRLGNGRIGTDDERIIREIVAPPQNVSLHINITWEDGAGPGSKIAIYSRQDHHMFEVQSHKETEKLQILQQY